MSARLARPAAIALAAAGVLALGGCASLTLQQQKSEAEIKAFADETAQVYGLSRISLLVGQDVASTGGTYRRGLFTISTPLLLSPYRDSVVAHEMAHYVLGHDAPLRSSTGYDRQREQELRELDANAKAVEILVRVSRISEEQALRTLYAHLIAVHRGSQRGTAMLAPGHRPPCEEVADLLGRFPHHASWTGSLECAPEALARGIRPHGPRAKAVREPGREGSASEQLVYAYFTDRPPASGTALRTGAGSNLPPNVADFWVDEDRDLVLFLAVKNTGKKIKVASRWVSADGVQRRWLEWEVDQSAARGAWTWLTHGRDIGAVWLWPGRWRVTVSLDGVEAGTYRFELHPGAGQ